MSENQLLEVSGLSVEFPRAAATVRAAQDLKLGVRRGEIVALVGESGCGKSASALGLIGLVPPPGQITSGKVLLDGVDLLSLSGEELRRQRGAGIAYVPQEPSLALSPVLNIGSQIIDVIRAHREVSRAEAQQEAVAALRRVGIPDPERRSKAYAHEFSGGMKQRALIALALAAQPKLLVADEPTTAVDVTLQAGLLELFRKLVDEGDLGGILLITHDLGVVAAIADRVLVMYAGRIVEEAPTQELFKAAKHPYTKALIRSTPTADAERGRLPTIPGQVPDLAQLPSGCAFHPRCDQAVEACRQKVPELLAAGRRRLACPVESLS